MRDLDECPTCEIVASLTLATSSVNGGYVMANSFVVVRVGIHAILNWVHINTNRPCAGSVGVSAVDVETLELHGVCRVGQPLGDGDGAVVVGPPDTSTLWGVYDVCIGSGGTPNAMVRNSLT